MKIIIASLLLLAATTAFAEPSVTASAPPPNTLGVDAIAIVPVGDYANFAAFGMGPAVRIEIPVGPGSVTGHTGAIFHAIKNNPGNMASFTAFPIFAGYRLPFGASGFYAAGEVGATILFASVDTPYGGSSDTDTKLGLSLVGGYRRGALDIRAGMFAPDIAHAVGLMASAGYDFVAF